MTSITSATTPTASTSATTSSAASTAETQKNQFLQLLITQLKNQDPTDPLDTNEFSSQLVQYSSLEQSIDMNDKLDQLISQASLSSSSSAFSYIGATAQVDTDTAPVQSGSASWAYDLNNTANSVYLTVSDTNGNILYEQQGESAAGSHNFTLDLASAGIDPDDYNSLVLSVNATDSSGNAIDKTIRSYALIDGVQTIDGTTSFSAGDITFAWDDISAVKQS